MVQNSLRSTNNFCAHKESARDMSFSLFQIMADFNKMSLNDTRDSINNKRVAGIFLEKPSYMSGTARTMLVWNLKGNSTAAGLSECRKLLSRAVLGAIAPDICLFQESPWIPDKILTKNIRHQITQRTWEAHGTNEVCVLWDVATLSKVTGYTVDSFDTNSPAPVAIPSCVLSAGRKYGIELNQCASVASSVLAEKHASGGREREEAAAVFAVLERLALVELSDNDSGKSCIFASFHGKYVGQSIDEKNAFCAGALALVNDIAKIKHLDAICGGDFNHDLEQFLKKEEIFAFPTHRHSSRRNNRYDWIVVTAPDILTNIVRAANLFPLPAQSRTWVITYRKAIKEGNTETFATEKAKTESSAISAAPLANASDLFELWADDRWYVLAYVLKESEKNADTLYETPDFSMFDHDPLTAEIQL
jgi:hypothetical protein